jgi:hypothetical protein
MTQKWSFGKKAKKGDKIKCPAGPAGGARRIRHLLRNWVRRGAHVLFCAGPPLQQFPALRVFSLAVVPVFGADLP